MKSSKIHSHIPARKIAPLAGYPVKTMDDVYALRKLGIDVMPQGNSSAYAMDANLVAPLTTPSVNTPIQFLQAWLPGFVNVITQARKIDDMVGMTTIGAWEDEEVIQGVSERTGFATPYLDDTNTPFANWNVNFNKRTIVRFEEGINIGRLSEERASRMNFSEIEAKRSGAAVSLEIERNYIGFYGYNAGANATYGFLNDPSLPAYANVPAGAAGYTTWATKTALEIIADIQGMANGLRTASGDLIDVAKTPTTLVVATAAREYLNTPTQFGYSVAEYITKNYPAMRIESAPELTSANGGSNVTYLYADTYATDSTDDGSVFIQMVPAKIRTIGVQQLAKGFQEVFSNATAGVMCKRPWAVVRRSGI